VKRTDLTAGDAKQANGLVGIWRLVSWELEAEDGNVHNLFGSHPRGYLIVTREGRMMALVTADKRHAGMSDAERAALHKTMLSYTGRYRLEGAEFITTVDASWNEGWNATEQRRHFRIEANRLFVETEPGPSILYPGKNDFRRLVWERDG
jgi:hypothetical protein